jgi:hypothetical protein
MSSLSTLSIYEKLQSHCHECIAFKSVFSHYRSRERVVLRVPRLMGKTIEESCFDSGYE